MTLDTTFKVKGERHQAALVGCTVRPTWTYSNGDVSVRVHDVYRVATWRPPTASLLYYVLLVLSLIDLFVVYDVTAAPRAAGTSFFSFICGPRVVVHHAWWVGCEQKWGRVERVVGRDLPTTSAHLYRRQRVERLYVHGVLSKPDTILQLDETRITDIHNY